VKAEIIGGGSKSEDALSALFSTDEKLPGGAVTPPYDFDRLYKLYEMSGILRPNIDAYVTNIDSFGHHFVPSIDIGHKDADIRIADAIYYERYLENPAATPTEPTDDEVAQRKEELRRTARLEYSRLKTFFGFCCPDMSFVELRRRTRQDLEVIGNAWWEVARNELGEISNFYYMRPLNMRLTAQDEEETEVQEHIKVTDITWKTVKRHKRFRRSVQLLKGKKPTFFKELGDPRVISRKTGKPYESVEAMRQKEGQATLEATEVIHFLIFSPDSIYGVPRWVPNLPAVLGSRELDEVNLGYFKNNVVPPLALLCSGGRFGRGVAERIEEFIDEHLKGRKGIHRILVLEAEGQKASGEPGPKAVPQVKFVPLRDVQQTDALFQQYDKRNTEKLAQSFRLPRMLRGDDSMINRATAFAGLRFAEEQVFEPEREQFDAYINREILPILHISFWLFRSNAPVTRDPEKMVDMVDKLVKNGVLLPAEGRELAADIFNRQFVELSEDWSNQPLPLTIAQLQGGGAKTLEPSPPVSGPEEEEQPPPPPAAEPAEAVTRAGTPLRSLGD
jgi:PBSX family phage portal protein